MAHIKTQINYLFYNNKRQGEKTEFYAEWFAISAVVIGKQNRVPHCSTNPVHYFACRRRQDFANYCSASINFTSYYFGPVLRS